MIIKVKNLKKSYKDKEVLKEINFEINKPEIVALVGPNGSGKSTLLNALVNQIDIDGGKIEICGLDHQNVNIFSKISYLRDNSVLYPYMTGLDHLAYAAGVYRIKRKQIDNVIVMTEIGDFVNQKVNTYSLGMKQQLLIALALLNNPDLIIMDEPINGLDPSRILFFRQLLLDLNEKGKTVLMSSHTLGEVDMVTNHILFLKNGIIIEEYLDNSIKSSEIRYIELFEQ